MFNHWFIISISKWVSGALMMSKLRESLVQIIKSDFVAPNGKMVNVMKLIMVGHHLRRLSDLKEYTFSSQPI
jgi:uncharacterized radical SAM superfamily protein